MSKRNFEIVALLISVLVIVLPVHSAQIFATELYVTKVSGRDGINGYRKKLDETIITVRASIDGDNEITPEQIKVKINDASGEYAFESCSKNKGYSSCTYRRYGDVTVAKHNYTLNMYDDFDKIVSAVGTSIIIDNMPPEISKIAITPKITTGKVNVTYKINDYAYTKNNECVGIKKISFYRDDFGGNIIKTVEPKNPVCEVEDSFEYNANTEGNLSICVNAIDNFGHVSVGLVCDKFEVDNKPPEVTLLGITDKSGNNIGYLSSEGINAVITAEIIDHNIDKSSITGDFSALNPLPEYKQKYPDMCIWNGSSLTCNWNVKIKPQTSAPANIIITASDRAGNTIKQQFSTNFKVDNKGPKVLDISTEKGPYQQKHYFGTTTTIVATIKDEGVGVSDGNIFLDLSEIGGSSSSKADECFQEGYLWKCYWNDVEVNAPNGKLVTILVNKNSQDNLGNKIIGTYAQEFIVDKSPPKVVASKLVTIHGKYNLGNFTLKGDSLEITADIIEKTSLRAEADLTELISGESSVPGDCTSEGNLWKCKWHTKSIDRSGPYTATLKLSFLDYAGNKAEVLHSLKVEGLETESSPNHWNSIVSCTPENVDRQVTTLVNQRIYCHIALRGQDDLKTLSLRLGECEDIGNNSGMDYVKSVELMNAVPGSKDPYIKVTLKTANMDIDSIKLNCPIYIRSKVGDTVMVNEEKEDVSFTINFYNLPLGELSDSVKEKIDNAKKVANSTIGKLITGLRKMVDYSRVACNLLYTGQKVVVLFQTVSAIMAKAETFPGPQQLAVHQYRKSVNYLTEGVSVELKGIFKFFNKFCKFINCRHSFNPDAKWTGWLGKWQNLGNSLMNKFPFAASIEAKTGKKPSDYMNPRDSMAVSVLTACIPGIIYNLDKYRQVECLYADCLEKSVDSGIPLFVCENQKEYATCKYLIGEIFKVIPITAIFDYYASLVKGVLANPLGVIDVAAGAVCMPHIEKGSGSAYVTCSITKTVALFGEIVSDISSMIKGDFWRIRKDYCKSLVEGKKK